MSSHMLKNNKHLQSKRSEWVGRLPIFTAINIKYLIAVQKRGQGAESGRKVGHKKWEDQ